MPTTDHTNDKKVARVIDKVMQVLNKSKLNTAELLVFYGNLGYHIGGSMAGLTEEKHGPSLAELKQMYHLNPTVDVALMLQGLMVTDWEQTLKDRPALSNISSKKKE